MFSEKFQNMEVSGAPLNILQYARTDYCGLRLWFVVYKIYYDVRHFVNNQHLFPFLRTAALYNI